MNINIDPEAALRAVSAESEWRRNRVLILENEVTRLDRENQALKVEIKALKAAAQPPKEAPPARAKRGKGAAEAATNGD